MRVRRAGKPVKIRKDETFMEKYGPYNKARNFEEWDANVGRKKRVETFRKCAALDEAVEITEDIINNNKFAFDNTCLHSGKSKERLKAELLRQPWTGFEDYDWY